MSVSTLPLQSQQIVEAWARQLLDLAYLLEGDGQVEIRVYANRGKVRKAPMVILNGGPQENVSP